MKKLLTILILLSIVAMKGQSLHGLEVIKMDGFNIKSSIAIDDNTNRHENWATPVLSNLETSLFKFGFDVVSMKDAENYLEIKNNGDIGNVNFHQQIELSSQSLDNINAVYVITDIQFNDMGGCIKCGRIKYFRAKIVDLSNGSKIVGIVEYAGKPQKNYGKDLFRLICEELRN